MPQKSRDLGQSSSCSLRLDGALSEIGDLRVIAANMESAVSILANIAEGFRRRGKADKVRFLNTSEASLEESRYYLY